MGLGVGSAGRAALSAAGFQLIEDRPLAGLGLRVLRLGVPAGLSEAAGIAEAQSLVPGADFDFNHLYASNAEPCTAKSCWAAQLISLPARAADACAAGAPVAIIDTGVETGHPALAGARIETRSFVPDGLAPAPADHGTAIAALLVGRPEPGVAPLAPGARLLAAAAFSRSDGRDNADAVALLRAMDWAVAGRARVIAFALAGPHNALLEAGIRAAARRTNLVAAAGNGGPRGPAAYPAAYREVFAVAALDARRRPYRSGTRGAYIDAAAPGVGVMSAMSGGRTRVWSGSSFAVPYAVAALLRARAATDGDPGRAADLLLSLAEDLGAPGRDAVTGVGLLVSPEGACQ